MFATKEKKALSMDARKVLIRYMAALLLLAAFTIGSFLSLKGLMSEMRLRDVLLAEASELRSSIHKTMLALDEAARKGAGTDEQVRMEAEALQAALEHMLATMREVGADEEDWEIVQAPEVGLEASVRILVAEGLAGSNSIEEHGAMPAHTRQQAPPRLRHTGPEAAEVGQDGPHATLHAQPEDGNSGAQHDHDAHSPAMTSIDSLVEHLRANGEAAKERASNLHDALGAATLFILIAEAFIIFRPLMRRAETENARAELATTELEYLASHDALTGLLNRGQIDRILEVAVRDAASQNSQLGLVLLDLDEFKPINDSLGHAAGDAVLVAVAERVRRAVGPSGVAGRLGGDEFIVLLRGEQVEEDVEILAQRLLADLRAPLEHRGHVIHPKASIGFAVFPVAGNNVAALLSAADLAMYAAKRAGRGRISVFSEQMRAECSRARLAEHELRRAFENGEFEVHYQTIHGSAADVTGVEALIRWRHPERGLLLPSEFLEGVAKLRQMSALTYLVLSTAIRQLGAWRASGLLDAPVHINVGNDFLYDAQMREVVERALSGSAIDPYDLVFEVSKDVSLDDSKIVRAIDSLREVGIGIALDSYGLGKASLLNVEKAPIKSAIAESI